MKSISCLVLFVGQLSFVSGFAPHAGAGVSKLQSPLVLSVGRNGRPVASIAHSGSLNMKAELGNEGVRASHAVVVAPRLISTLGDRLVTLFRSVLVKLAVLASIFMLTPALALAPAGGNTASSDVAAVELPENLREPDMRSSESMKTVYMTHAPSDTDSSGVAAAAAAPTDGKKDMDTLLVEAEHLVQQEESAAPAAATIAADERAAKDDMASQLLEAEKLSRDRKNWLYSDSARNVGLLLVSAASLGVGSHMSADGVQLVSQAQPQAASQNHASEAWKHASAAFKELTSSFEQEALPAAKQAAEQVKHHASTLTTKISALLHEPTQIVPSITPAQPAATTTITHVSSSAVGSSAVNGYREVPNFGDGARKSWSIFRSPGGVPEAHVSGHSAGHAGLAAEALEFAAPAGSEADLHNRYPEWKKITRAELLHMDLHHGHDHDDDEEDLGIIKSRGFFGTLVLPLTWAYGFIKILWPLTMLSVPIIYVFPWELLTGGFKSSRKFFNDVPGSKAEENTANQARDRILYVSTVLNIIVSVIFGGGGGGGGGGH